MWRWPLRSSASAFVTFYGALIFELVTFLCPWTCEAGKLPGVIFTFSGVVCISHDSEESLCRWLVSTTRMRLFLRSTELSSASQCTATALHCGRTCERRSAVGGPSPESCWFRRLCGCTIRAWNPTNESSRSFSRGDLFAGGI